MKIKPPVHTRERRRLRKRSGGVTYKLATKNKMLQRMEDRLELYRHKDGILVGGLKPLDSGLDSKDPGGSQGRDPPYATSLSLPCYESPERVASSK
jgi:hypothetical protein